MGRRRVADPPTGIPAAMETGVSCTAALLRGQHAYFDRLGQGAKAPCFFVHIGAGGFLRDRWLPPCAAGLARPLGRW